MTNSQYLERFKSMVAVIGHYGGSIGSHPRLIQDEIASITSQPFVGPGMTNYTQEIQDRAFEQAKQRCLACMLVMGLDKTHYGDMLTEIQNDYQKNVNLYPVNVTGAYALMVNWIPKFVSGTPAPQQGSSFAQGGNIECWGCG
jgi:hypothetical protein